MTNSAMQKFNINIHNEGTTKMNSHNVLMQQDDAQSHTVRKTVSYTQSEVTFIEPAMWTANSPHLNPVEM